MTDKIKKVLSEKQVDAVWISDGYNIRYLSGFRSEDASLFLSGNKKVLITDSRYIVQANREAKGFEVVITSMERGYAQILAELVEQEKVKRLGFEDLHMIYSTFQSYKEKVDKVEWVPVGESVNHLRILKTEQEIEWLAKAESIGDQAFDHILGMIKPGITEIEIATELDYYMKKCGASGNSFDTIVASGVNSSMPHAIPSEKKIENGDFITMDFGCKYQGYCSDMTRTIVVGKASDEQKKLYQTVLDAQMAALNQVKAGMTGVEVDALARDVIKKAGYGEYFGHGLGHSVGLFIHEDPSANQRNGEPFQPNTILTIEPGIYLPEIGGVRIEDMIVVEKNGHRNLAHSPKNLIEL